MLSLIDNKRDSFTGHSLGLTRLATKILLTNCPINCLKWLSSVRADLVVAAAEEIIE